MQDAYDFPTRYISPVGRGTPPSGSRVTANFWILPGAGRDSNLVKMTKARAPTPPTVNQMDCIISQVAEGNESALSTLYDLADRLVFGLALRILSDVAEAEEVTLFPNKGDQLSLHTFMVLPKARSPNGLGQPLGTVKSSIRLGMMMKLHELLGLPEGGEE